MNLPERFANDTIEPLVDAEHVLARNLAAYREVMHVALEQLHGLTRERDRLREDNRRLRDEYRRQRETTVPDSRRAAA